MYKSKSIILTILLGIAILTSLAAPPVTASTSPDTATSGDSIPIVYDLPSENFAVQPTGTCVTEILTGKGTYFSEVHNLLTCIGPKAEGLAAYCIEPSKLAPSASTPYDEVGLTDSTSSTTAEKAGAAAVLMYGYGGESSINNDIIGLSEANQNIGGTYGIYVIDGVAKTGIMVNGTFFKMTQKEAHALTAAVIHKLNGSNITAITGSRISSDSQVVEAYDYLYSLGSYSKFHTDVNGWDSTNAFLYAFTMPSRDLTIELQKSTGEWVSIPDDYNTDDFDWSIYRLDDKINYRVTYKAFRCESKLIHSRFSSGTSGRINYSHEDFITFSDYPSSNGYYDYISISEGSSNEIPVNITYGKLTSSSKETIRLGIIDPDYGGFPPCQGTEFTQTVTISAAYSDISNGKKLELNISIPEAAAHTPYYGDGDNVDGSHTSARFFTAYMYQDTAVASPNITIPAISKQLCASKARSSIQLKKSSELTYITDNNSCYSLKLAKYGLYASKEDATAHINPIAEFTTDEDGEAIITDIPIGTYYISESEPPASYKLNDSIYVVDVPSSVPVSLNVTDTPITNKPHVLLYKQNEQQQPIQGAEFEVKFYPLYTDTNPEELGYTAEKTWHFISDENGYVYMDEEHLKDGDEFYRDLSNEIILPLGTLTIRESMAPEGYVTDKTLHIYHISDEEGFSCDTIPAENIFTNAVCKQAFQIVKYGETSKNSKCLLANAGFMACNISDLDIDQNGNYIWDSEKAVILTENNQTELFTNEDGYACSIPLDYGTYLVKETTVPYNYLAIDDFLVNISIDSKTPQEIRYFTDESFKAYIKICKYDISTENIILDNPACFRIWSYDTGEYISFTSDEESNETYTDLYANDDGILITPAPLFPGKYGICEITCPNGYYNQTPKSFYDFEISADKAYESLSNLAEYSTNDVCLTCNIFNTPITGKIEIYKTGDTRKINDDNSFTTESKPLANVTFDIIADENLYSSDNQGILLYEKGTILESITTDENGYACSSDILPFGKYIIKEHTPDDYEPIEEISVTLSCDGNAIEYEVADNIHKYILETLHIHNTLKIPTLSTTARDGKTKNHIGTIGTNETIIDTIKYENLIPGEKYTIKGVLMNPITKSTYIINDSTITGETEFICESENGSVEVLFNIDSSSLSGKDVVLYEELYHSNDIIAVHEDINNKEQTITYPDTSTDYPRTGDSFSILPFIILVLLSIITFISIISRKNKK